MQDAQDAANFENAVKVLTLTKQVDTMRAALLALHEKGGLGHEAHERILEAVGAPNGKFCREPRNCIAAGRCMNCAKYDRSCND